MGSYVYQNCWKNEFLKRNWNIGLGIFSGIVFCQWNNNILCDTGPIQSLLVLEMSWVVLLSDIIVMKYSHSKEKKNPKIMLLT